VKNEIQKTMTALTRYRDILLMIAALLMLMPTFSTAKEVRVGTWKTAQTIQPFFYEQFFPGHEKVRVFSFTNPADQKVALLAGSLDMCGTTLAHAIHAASRGQPVVIVASLCNKCSALVIKKDGLIKTVKDLKNKKIAYVPGTMHEILLRETLVQNGLTPDRDVHLTRVDFFDMGLALARGDIDAFLSGEPFPTLAVEKGYGKILAYPYFGESIGTINAGLLVKRKTIEENPGLVQKIVDAHIHATEYLKAHPHIWLKRASSFGTDLHTLQKAAPNMELSWHMDRNFIQKARNLGEKMQALGVITRQPDYNQLFDMRFVSKRRAPKGALRGNDQ
jgi:NitT/TauT family transport system substrate-binding protein